MNVTCRQLRAFVEVARRASFTEAGRALHLTQSATSALVRDLEKEVGLSLGIGKSNGMYSCPPGRARPHWVVHRGV